MTLQKTDRAFLSVSEKGSFSSPPGGDSDQSLGVCCFLSRNTPNMHDEIIDGTALALVVTMRAAACVIIAYLMCTVLFSLHMRARKLICRRLFAMQEVLPLSRRRRRMITAARTNGRCRRAKAPPSGTEARSPKASRSRRYISLRRHPN